MSVRSEPSDRWVRVDLGKVAVAETRHPLLFWEDGSPVPFYALPRDDVHRGRLVPATPGRDHPFFGPRGPVLEMFDVEAGGTRAERAAWILTELPEHLVLSWQPGLLVWREEDVEVATHPKDPHKRVDALPSSRHVIVRAGGQTVADSRHPVLLFETHLPTRYYLPASEVRLDLMTPAEHQTRCPYKGVAGRYWDLPGLDHVAWSYSDPDPAVAAIAGRIAFFNEDVDIEVDGEPQDRPVTSFSRPAVTVTRLRAGDGGRWRRLRLDALRDAWPAIYGDLDSETALPEAEWEGGLAVDARATLAASVRGRDVGVATCGPSSWDTEADPRHLDLAGLWVAPFARGAGVSQALIAAALEHAREQGALAVTLWIFDANTAVERAVLRAGFGLTGRAGTDGEGRGYAQYRRDLPRP